MKAHPQTIAALDKMTGAMNELEEALIFDSARGVHSSRWWERLKDAKASVRKLKTAIKNAR